MKGDDIVSNRIRASKPAAYEFEITLCDVHPSVWRRFCVPANITFQRLHDVIQVVMGWENYHLYEFRFGKTRISTPDDEFEVDATHFDARRKRLPSLGFDRDDVLGYLYDFGDNWMHVLRVIRPIYDLGDRPAYACLDGARSCPPEDVGGPHGYADFLKIISQPNHPEYEHMRLWSGGTFSPMRFDKEAVNQELWRRFME